MRGFMIKLLCGTMLLCLLLAGCAGNSAHVGSDASQSAEQDKIVVRIGSNRAIGTVTPYLAKEMGYFDGKDYEVEVVDFSDGTTIMEAMAAGEVEMGLVGIVPVATWSSKGFDVRVVASANGGGHVILSTEERGIQTVADLKGKTMTVPNIGTVTDALLKAYILPRFDMSVDDIVVIPGMKPVDMANVMATTDDLDAIMTWEPYASMAELERDNIVVVYDAVAEYQKNNQSDAIYPTNVMAASGEFCDEHPEIVKNILSEIEKTVEYTRNNIEDSNEKIATVLGISQEAVNKARERCILTFDVDVDATNEVLSWARDLGYIAELPAEDDLFDLKYIN